MAKITLDQITGGYDLSKINTNFDKIEAELQNKVLYRDNPVGEANTMEDDLDMNANTIYNAASISTNALTINGQEVVASEVFVTELPSVVGQTDKILTNNGAAPYWNVGDPNLASTVSDSLGDALVGVKLTATGSVARTQHKKNAEIISVKDFGATGDGVTDDTSGIQAAVTHCNSSGEQLFWPDGTYLTTASITNLHSVKHTGRGVLKRGADLFYLEPDFSQANTLYISTTGDNANDGLSTSQPRLTFQSAFDVLKNYGPFLEGTWTISAAAGTYTINAGSHNHFTPSKNRVVIKGVTAGHPNVPTTIIDGGGILADYLHGINCDGPGIRVQVQDIKFQNFKSAGNTRIGLVAANGADLYTINVHGLDCSWTAIMAKECEAARVSGGILDANGIGAYGFISDSTRTSFGYNAASTADGPIVKNALSAGVYWSTGSQGHCDYVQFQDNAVGFLCAENSRCDTVGNNYKRNIVAKRAQTGGVMGSGGAAETFNDGTGDANTTNLEYKAFSGNSAEMSAQGSGSWMRVAFDRTARSLSGTTPTTLTTPYTIDAKRMQGVGKSCKVHVFGVWTALTSGSTITVNFGGMALTLSVPGAATNVAFELEATLHEVAGGYRAFGRLTQGLTQVRHATATSGFNNAASQDISIAATLANAGDSMSIYRTDVYLIG